MTSWGRSAGSWPDLIQIVAVAPRPERRVWGRLVFVGWLLDVLSGDGWERLGGGGGSRPTQVVVRYRGREHPLFKEHSFESAKEKCERIAGEYDAMDTADWCQRYRVPDHFFR